MNTTTQTNATFTGYQKFLIVILALLQFTIVLDFMIISPLGDALMKELSISTGRFGLIVSSYAFSAGIAGILAAGFADKYDRKKLMVFFYTGFIIGTFFCGIANSYYTLLAARVVTGLFGGVIGSISLAIVTDMFALNQRGRVMGFVQMAFAVSQVLGIPAGVFIANNMGWHYTFLMIVALAVIVLVLVLFKMQPVTAHLQKKSDKNALLHLWHTIGNKKYQVGFTATGFLAIGGFMMMPFSASFLVNNVGITQAQLPLVFMFTGLASIIVMPLIGKISDTIDKFKLFAFGSVLAAILAIVYANLPVVPLWQVIVVNIVMFTGIMSRMVPATSLTTGIPALQDRGAYMSINSSLQQISGGVGAILGGLIVHQPSEHSPLQNFPILGLAVSGFILLTIFLVYRIDRLIKRTRVEDAPPMVPVME